jgi:hypothetical protein
MPSKDFIAKEKSLPRLKTSKVRLGFLSVAKAADDFRLKPILKYDFLKS